MNSILERWIGSCRRELLDRTRHLMIVLGEYEDFYNTHRPHRTPEPSCAASPAAKVAPPTWTTSASGDATAPEA
jgi:hypothetical protein